MESCDTGVKSKTFEEREKELWEISTALAGFIAEKGIYLNELPIVFDRAKSKMLIATGASKL